ncbi:MAG TPA: hypothetical protein VGG74_18315 [Kofleriaceae bacterium]
MVVLRVLGACTLAACGFHPASFDGDAGATSGGDAPLIAPSDVGHDATIMRGSDAMVQLVEGSLVVTHQIVSGAIDVTSEGTADWAVWGATAEADFDHKANGGTQITNWTEVGAGTVYGYGNDYNDQGNDGFTWSDGTPMATENTAQYCGVWIDNKPNGFSTTAPAGMHTHTLRIYVGGADATGTLTLHMSDSSVGDFSDSGGLGSTSESWAGVYQIVYNAAHDDATLDVSWAQSSSASGGDVNLSAATLQ